jgi:opine dehydrogenase
MRSTGQLEGEFPIEVTSSAKEMCANCDLIFLATTANDYLDVAENFAPHLTSQNTFVLFSSKLGGSLVVSHYLQSAGVLGVDVLETDSLFASRVQSVGHVWIRGIKKWTLYSGNCHSATKRYEGVLESFFPGLEPAQNLIQRGLTDFGALAHPLTLLINMNEVDRKRSFLFYYEGYTERSVALLEKVESEFQQLAAAYDTSLVPARELLNRYYGCNSESLLEAMRTVPNYRFSQSPEQVHHRYILEDVPCTLIPAQQLARKAGLKTPMIDAVITIASTLLDYDFESHGRTLERLGWGGLSYQDIRRALTL